MSEITQLCKMLHENYFQLLRLFVGDYTREIYGRKLVGQLDMSHKNIALKLEELEKELILRSRKEGTLKYYGLNLRNTLMKDILTLTEITAKLHFLSQHRVLAHIFQNDSRIVGVFGSYAKGTETKTSDIDLFIIGSTHSKGSTDYARLGATYDLDISVKYFSAAEWKRLLRAKNPLCAEIVLHHVVLFGAERFVSSLWEVYFGLD